MTAARRKVSLTIAVDAELLKRARIRAIEGGTTVNAVLAAHLGRYVDPHVEQAAAIDALLANAGDGDRGGGAKRGRRRGRRDWTRAELYEDRLRRHGR